MPKRTDIKSILIIGAGPIVIGQACEFDYSGTQACKALKEEGYRVILVNSNPATIMTDPELADATYIEPITPEVVAKIIAKERPDALLPTMGGQTALNTALSLRRMGVLDRYNVEMIGADARRHRQGRGPRAVPRGDGAASGWRRRARCWPTPPTSRTPTASRTRPSARRSRPRRRPTSTRRSTRWKPSWNLGEGDRKQRYMSHAMAVAAQALDHRRPAGDHPPLLHASAAPAAASPTTAPNSSRSSSAASTPRRPPKC